MGDPRSECEDGETLDLIALLRLNNGSAAHRPLYTACGSNSMKRRSPSGPEFSEPEPKKLFVDHKIPFSLGPAKNPEPPQEECNLGGFSKISLDLTQTPSPKKASASALPPCLRRTVSDLTPPRAAADSMEADSMRLRRMKDRLAEMGQWCNEVVRDGFEDDNNNTTKNVSEADPEELVSVERVGECFTIQFKCPCGKGYQILISGNSCYYKLM